MKIFLLETKAFLKLKGKVKRKPCRFLKCFLIMKKKFGAIDPKVSSGGLKIAQSPYTFLYLKQTDYSEVDLRKSEDTDRCDSGNKSD